MEQLKAQNRREAMEHAESTGHGAFIRASIAARAIGQAYRGEVRARGFHRKEFPPHRALVVVKGTSEVTIGEDVRTIHEKRVGLYCDRKRRLANPGKIPLELMEVQ